MNFNYFMPAKLLFGAGKLGELHEQNLPGKKALIVTTAGKSVKKYGYLARLEQELDKAGVAHELFDVVLPNPIIEHVHQGAELARKTNCDFLIGLGGGSSIDSAKSIAVMATNPGSYWDYVSGGSGKGKKLVNKPLPVIAITTTAGTGTEADPWTVITNGSEKIGYGNDDTYPVLSIIDPELMLTVPAKLTAYQGFDALFHSTEGYLNRYANELSDIYALKAIELIGRSLAKAVNDGGDIKAREDVALANTLSGINESCAGCTSEHSIEHAMSGFHPKLEHGAGLIMVSLAYYSKIVEKGASSEKLINMARALGDKSADKPADFVKALKALQVACGVSELKMSDYGITQGELPEIAAHARETMGGLFAVDPCEISNADVIDILEKSYK